MVAVFGGAPIRDQVAQLKEGAQVVVGTVGRVMDLMGRHELLLNQARYVVLDEADEMLDLGFLEDVERILGRCPSGRQTALFSATMPPPIKKLAEKRMFDPVTIKVRPPRSPSTPSTSSSSSLRPGQGRRLAGCSRPSARTRRSSSRAPRSASTGSRARSTDAGVRVKALHGDMTQGARDGVMIAFKDGRERLLVATDIAARGLDISGVTHVVNYDIPNSPDVYVHRIGRTGRVGRDRAARSRSSPPSSARDLEAIERHANTEIARGRPTAARARGASRRSAAGRASRGAPSASRRRAAEPAARRRAHQAARARGPRAKLMVGAGRTQGFEPADLIGAIVDHSHLEGEDVHNVRVLERFSFVEVPAERADDVVEKVRGNDVRGVTLRLEVAKR